MHRQHTIQVTGTATKLNQAAIRRVLCRPPVPGNAILRPLGAYWCHTLLSWPKDSVAHVIPFEARCIGRCFEVWVFGAEEPFVRIWACSPVSTKEDFTAGFTTEQFKNARAAVAREPWYIVQTPRRAFSLPRWGSVALWVRANPHSLQVSEEQVGTHDEWRLAGCVPRLRETRQ